MVNSYLSTQAVNSWTETGSEGVYLGADHHHWYAQVMCECVVSQRQQHALLLFAPSLRGTILSTAWLCVLLELLYNYTYTQRNITH